MMQGSWFIERPSQVVVILKIRQENEYLILLSITVTKALYSGELYMINATTWVKLIKGLLFSTS